MGRDNSLLHLDPRFAGRFQSLATRLRDHGFRPFETYRSPEAQMIVFNLGTSHARPGQSAHQYGLAVDFVAYADGTGFYWPKSDDPMWNHVAALAELEGLEAPIKWDPGHVQVPAWKAIRNLNFRPGK